MIFGGRGLFLFLLKQKAELVMTEESGRERKSLAKQFFGEA
jgi:hypothetical protein